MKWLSLSCWSTVNGSYYCVVVLLNTLERPECFSALVGLKCLQTGDDINNGQQAARRAPLTLVIERAKDIKG